MALAAVAAVALVAVAVVAGTRLWGAREGSAKNVILLIGDGMGPVHVEAARQVRHGASGRLAMEALTHQGTVSTWSVLPGSDTPDLVTDSASSATAWSTGVKTYDAAIGVDADGQVVPSIMERAAEAGMRTGNVSTAEITDATPAAQLAHATDRSCQGPEYTEEECGTLDGAEYAPIAAQIARGGVADVILGGGNDRFTAEHQAVMEDDGYTVLGTLGETPATGAELAAAGGRDQRVVGLFNDGNLTVELNRAKGFPDPSVQEEPSLAQMTAKAIALLADSEEGEERGFFLQVEGASIDKRSHANDAAQALGEVLALDDAVAVATEFAEESGDTLVIVTADHECGGLAIVGRDGLTNAESTSPPANQSGTSDTESPVREEGGEGDPARSGGPVNGSGDDAPGSFAPATLRTADDPEGVEDGDPEASLWVAYLTGDHTGADVPVYATGPGAEAFDRRLDNTDLHDLMTAALEPLAG